MKKIDFNNEFKLLPNTPNVGKLMYEVLADNISMADSKIISPRKGWEWSVTLYDKKELELVSEDVSLLKKFIEEGLQSLPNFITAQLLYCLE